MSPKFLCPLTLCFLAMGCDSSPRRSPIDSDRDGGNFGYWTDATDVGPVFHYRRPAEMKFTTSYGQSDVHLHLIGNDRLNAFVHPEGGVDILVRDHGLVWLTRDPSPLASMTSPASVITEEGETIVIPSQVDPATGNRVAATEAEFGLGYVRFQPTEFQTGGTTIRAERIAWAPEGDDSLILVETRFVNTGAASASFEFHEQWPVDLVPLTMNLTDPSAHEEREGFRNRYTFAVSSATQGGRLFQWVFVDPPQPDARAPSPFGRFPPVILFPVEPPRDYGSLVTLPSPSIPVMFGVGRTVRLPEVLEYAATITVPPKGESRRAIAVGTQTDDTGLAPYERRAAAERAHSLRLSGPDIPAWLSRELVWHSAQLRQSAMYDAAAGRTVIGQGSAYLYLSGADGAQRDWMQFVLPLSYIDPPKAKDLLRYALQMVDDSGHRFYAVHGYGTYDDAVIHAESTDLDIYILLGVAYYVLATRDFAFLDEAIPVNIGRNQTGTRTVREHVRVAFRHMIDATGFGSHGLLRVGTGDWSDGIVFLSQDAGATREKGESTFNTGMAAWVLPMIAETVRPSASALADEMSAWAVTLSTRMAGQLTSSGWFRRGYGGRGEAIGDDRLFLEAQTWPLLAGIGTEAQRRKLIDTMWAQLDAPSPIGPLLLFPPSDAPQTASIWEEGWDVNGGVWPAIHMWAVPAYATLDPAKAWASMLRGTYHAHARAYPDIWYGIWSAPDSYNAHYAERPGETFIHLATAMTDFPIANMNPEAAPLYMAIEMAGLRPFARGLRLDPKLPGGAFTLRTPQLTVDWSPSTIVLTYSTDALPNDIWRIRLPDSFGGKACIGVQTLTADAEGYVEAGLGKEVRIGRCG